MLGPLQSIKQIAQEHRIEKWKELLKQLLLMVDHNIYLNLFGHKETYYKLNFEVLLFCIIKEV
jgi:hypothetical protein